ATGLGRVDGEAARGQPIYLPAGNGAEVARALKHHDLVEHRRPVDRSVYTETGKGHGRSVGRRLADDLSKLEEGAVRRQCMHHTVGDNIDTDGKFVEPGGGKQLQLEVPAIAAPDRSLAAKADVTVLIVIEIGPPVGNALRRGERLLRHFPGQL